jgi:hypothetical protein
VEGGNRSKRALEVGRSMKALVELFSSELSVIFM